MRAVRNCEWRRPTSVSTWLATWVRPRSNRRTRSWWRRSRSGTQVFLQAGLSPMGEQLAPLAMSYWRAEPGDRLRGNSFHHRGNRTNPFRWTPAPDGLVDCQRDRRGRRLRPLSVIFRASGMTGLRDFVVVVPRIFWVWPVAGFFVTATTTSISRHSLGRRAKRFVPRAAYGLVETPDTRGHALATSRRPLRVKRRPEARGDRISVEDESPHCRHPFASAVGELNRS